MRAGRTDWPGAVIIYQLAGAGRLKRMVYRPDGRFFRLAVCGSRQPAGAAVEYGHRQQPCGFDWRDLRHVHPEFDGSIQCCGRAGDHFDDDHRLIASAQRRSGDYCCFRRRCSASAGLQLFILSSAAEFSAADADCDYV